MKFRAIITERNTTIHFTLHDLLTNKFSNRELLIPWLKAGNQPDRDTGMLDKNGKEIYEGDIIQNNHFKAKVFMKFGCYCVKTRDNTFYLKSWHIHSVVVGNIHEHPDKLKEG